MMRAFRLTPRLTFALLLGSLLTELSLKTLFLFACFGELGGIWRCHPKHQRLGITAEVSLEFGVADAVEFVRLFKYANRSAKSVGRKSLIKPTGINDCGSVRRSSMSDVSMRTV